MINVRGACRPIGDSRGVAICPALVGAPPLEIGHYANLAIEGGADVLHVDVMDGQFVPAVTFGDALVAQLRSRTKLPIDVHLLVRYPENHVMRFIRAGADLVTVHVEETRDASQILQMIKAEGAMAGIALAPSTPVTSLEELIPFVDLVVIMTANPGTSRFLPSMDGKVGRVRRMLDSAGKVDIPISVDGGMRVDTLPQLRAAGAQWFVAGSAVFSAGNLVAENIEKLRAATTQRMLPAQS